MKWRVVVLAALWFALVPRGASYPDAGALLAAAGRSGMTPHAFYVYAERRVQGDGTALYQAAQRYLAGVPGAQTALRSGNGEAIVAVAVVCGPNARAARENERRVRAALGHQARVTVCLSGRAKAQDEDLESAAQALLIACADLALQGVTNGAYASWTGEHAQAAVRANGEAYLGVPLIPLDY